MMMDKSTVLQQAIRGVTNDISFTNLWTSVISIGKGIKCRYEFDNDTNISKMDISQSLIKTEPFMDTLSIQNSLDIYRGKCRKEQFYFFHDTTLELLYFPPPTKLNEEWRNVIGVDDNKIDEY